MSTIYDEPRVDQSPLAPEPEYAPPTRLHVRRRSHRGRVVADAVAAVLLVGVAAESVPPGTPGHQLWTTIAGGSPVAPPAIASAAPQVDPQLAAIQAVIQKANAEQVQAIAAQNPSVMSDTATQAHYQQLVQINQNLLAQGVTSIQLTNLAWGPITINGGKLTATGAVTGGSLTSRSAIFTSLKDSPMAPALPDDASDAAAVSCPSVLVSTCSPGPGDWGG